MEHPQKHFKKRDAILSCLRATDVHPTADWVYSQLKPQIPDLSLGTVYRNLALFKSQGTIASVGIVKGVERFDGNPDPHVHFICTNCAKVLDLEQIQIPEELNQAAAQSSGGTVTACQLTFTGICGSCKNKMN